MTKRTIGSEPTIGWSAKTANGGIALALTLADRVESYKQAFPQFSSSWPHVSPDGRWLTAVWLLGNNYKGSGYYGAYPPGYLPRIRALFPEIPTPLWLHLFSGSLKPSEGGIRIDVRPLGQGVAPASVRADATRLPFVDGQLVMTAADPPYTKLDAKRYHTKPVNKPKVLRELARATAPGGFLVWLDTSLPLYRKDQWHHFGMICVQRSTNHRVRLCSLFAKV
jgi:hypothetical protein